MLTEKIIFNEERNVSLCVYVPDVSDEMPNAKIKPGVLVFPGGGYSFCSDREAEPVAFEFMARGFNVFILRYSLKENSKFPTPLNDAIQALETIRENCEKWHTDPNKIAVCGFSAGGHLAAALSTMSDKKPNACILGYPCILESTANVLANPVPSLEKFVSVDTPPTFIVAAADDTCVPIANSLEFAKALNEHSVPFEMHIYDRGGHGFSSSSDIVTMPSNREIVKNTKSWINQCVDWLNVIF